VGVIYITGRPARALWAAAQKAIEVRRPEVDPVKDAENLDAAPDLTFVLRVTALHRTGRLKALERRTGV
jgi:hypothetical protein